MTAFLTTESLSLSNPELFTLQACAVAHERQGEATEAAFMAKASNLGFAVAKPWDKYREAWCQMACPNEENGPSKIVAERCPNQQQDAAQVCPLKHLI